MKGFEKWSAEKNGRLTEERLRKKLEEKGYRVSRYVYPPGTFFPNHAHDIDKIDAVFSGRFKMTTPHGEVILEDGDSLAVPRGTVHSAEVMGPEPVVSFDATKES